MLDLKITLGCKVFITYTIVSIFIRNFEYGANYIKYPPVRRLECMTIRCVAWCKYSFKWCRCNEESVWTWKEIISLKRVLLLSMYILVWLN